MLWKPLSVNHIMMWFGKTSLNVKQFETGLSASVNHTMKPHEPGNWNDEIQQYNCCHIYTKILTTSILFILLPRTYAVYIIIPQQV